MKLLEETLAKIKEPDQIARQEAAERLESLIKPPRSLGVLEDMAEKMAGIYGSPRPAVGAKSVIMMAGDHGVVEEGVSAAPQEVTRQMLPAFVRGISGIGVLARHAGARLVVVDVGARGTVDTPGVIQRKVKNGTNNIAVEPAMTRAEAVQAVEAGIEMAVQEINSGVNVLATGDMGIGNTTPSSAILAAVSGLSAKEVAGRGTYVNDEVMARKERAIAAALEVNRPDPGDGWDVLSKVGGLEIGGLAGVILGGASRGVPVLIDGFISTAAAIIASLVEPRAREYIIASHLSNESGHRMMMEYLGLKPVLHMDMRLGEGTGAALAFHLLDASCRVLNEMATFEEARVMDMDDNMLMK